MLLDSEAVIRARGTRIEEEISRRGIKLRGGADRCGPCPTCGGTDRFSINIKKQVWNCRGCGEGGDVIKLVMRIDGVDFREACRILTGEDLRPITPHREPAKREADPSDDKSELARYLWSRSLPAVGSLVERYLKSRQCWLPSPNIRFLAARGDHLPAMIARFGDGPGVHLTKLKTDGTSKAGTDKDKIMIGSSVGCPIVVADNPDHGELLIAEGIEDAATLAIVTGWSAWAAGSAGRIPPIVLAGSRFERVFLAVDRDSAGAMALRNSRKIRRGVIPLHFAKTLDGKDSLDANKAMIRFGADTVLAAIEWCDAQASFRCGQIGFHAMQAAMLRANTIFTEMARL